MKPINILKCISCVAVPFIDSHTKYTKKMVAIEYIYRPRPPHRHLKYEASACLQYITQVCLALIEDQIDPTHLIEIRALGVK